MTIEDFTNEDAWPLVLLGLRLLVAGLLYLFLLAAFRTLRAELKAAPRTLPRRRPVTPPQGAPDPRSVPPRTPRPDARTERPALASAWLEITGFPADPARVGQRYPLAGPTLVGRDPMATIVLGDPHISARHARLLPRDETWWIEDLGSTNGTAVNDHPIAEPVPLGTGAELRLGPVRARVRVDPARAGR